MHDFCFFFYTKYRDSLSNAKTKAIMGLQGFAYPGSTAGGPNKNEIRSNGNKELQGCIPYPVFVKRLQMGRVATWFPTDTAHSQRLRTTDPSDKVRTISDEPNVKKQVLHISVIADPSRAADLNRVANLTHLM